MADISRVAVQAKPTKSHSEFNECETASIVVFVTANSHGEAILRARELLSQERWEILEVQRCDRIIEELVREHGGDILEAYETAVATGSAFRILPNNFAPGKDGSPVILPMRITEVFIDQVIADIGGERIPTDDKNQVVDYLIGEWIFELKDLQEEGLQQPARQQKLAGLFSRFAKPGLPVQINPSVLADNKRREFFDILSSPIKPQVKKASKQIRSTRGLLKRDDLKGGLIYLNTGFGSFSPEEFGPLVERYVRKDTTQIEAIFCAALWNRTNGFDSYVFYRAYPEKPRFPIVTKKRRHSQSVSKKP